MSLFVKACSDDEAVAKFIHIIVCLEGLESLKLVER